MKKLRKILCLAIALVMLVGIAACNTPDEPDDPDTPIDPGGPVGPVDPGDPKTLVVGYSMFSGKFSPFFGTTGYDMDVADMTQVSLLTNDRVGNIILKGIEGETHNYNGTDYHYSGIADFDIDIKADGTVDYNITIRDDIVFSDGEKMTIDDVIFNIYVNSDPTYDGSSTFYTLPITGMGSFLSGLPQNIFDKYLEIAVGMLEEGPDNDNFDKWSEALQELFWNTYYDQVGLVVVQDIFDYCAPYTDDYIDAFGMGDEIAMTIALWGFGWPGDPDDDEDEVFYTVSGAEFDILAGETPTLADFWAEIKEEADFDFGVLDYESVSDQSFADMLTMAFIAGEGPKDPDAGGEVMHIEGVKKTGDYSLTITTDNFDATSIYKMALSVAPLHYYGDLSQYDYDNNKFGFPKHDLSIVRDKTSNPVGAGAYKFLSFESGVVSFEANPNYYKGEPATKYIRFQETPDGDKLTGIISGSFDVTDPSFSTETVNSIKDYNDNGDLIGNLVHTSTVDNLGYGYIGIAAENVNVDGDPGSDDSKSLRAGLATVFAVYRNTVNNSYYGDRASTIQYPISNTSWAAPRPNDPGYKEAYSVDVDGNAIFTADMSEADREAAAIAAAIGFFKAAGYTFDDAAGEFTAAPEGASLVYEVIIPADGVGDHPAYGVLMAAKEGFASFGITLEINDPADSNVLWTSLDAGSAEIWCAAWQATIDPDMYQIYHSNNITGRGGTDSNNYGVDDRELDRLIMEARTSADQSFRKATYFRCLEIIMEWAVEIPNYQRQNAVIFSPERVNMSTITPDITTFWGWMNDIENIKMH